MPGLSPTRDGDARAESSRGAALLVVSLGVAVAIALAPLVGGILGAVVLSVLLRTPYAWLSARIGPNRAAGALLIGCLLLVCIPALIVGELAWAQAQNITLPAPPSTHWTLPFVDQAFGGTLGSLLPQLAGRVTTMVGAIASWAAGSAARGALNIGVMFLCLFFTLRSGSEMWRHVRMHLPFSEQSRDALGENLYGVTLAVVLGTLLSAVLQGTSMAAGFAIVGLPSPVFWGIATAFVSMIPAIGSALVWVPAVIILLVRHEPRSALIIAGFGWLLPSGIDHITRALVSRRVGNVHPLTTLLGAIVGIRIFGIIGLVVGPLMIAAFVELLDLYERDYGVAGATAPRVATSTAATSVEEVV